MEYRVSSVDTTTRCMLGDTNWEPLKAKTWGAAYKELQDSGGVDGTGIGRCIGRMYRDGRDRSRRVGWIFIRKDEYLDTHDKFIREDWYEVRS